MLFYDEKVFQSFRSRAITKATDLVVGKEYFSNIWPDRFVIKEITTDDTLHFPCVITTEGREVFLGDMNVGESYNPWMIFDNEATAKECEEILKISYQDDGDGDLYWEYDRWEYDRWDD